ncbi:MAG: hypothetical protein V1742_06785, partial [Pseudomonadota bacterium]
AGKKVWAFRPGHFDPSTSGNYMLLSQGAQAWDVSSSDIKLPEKQTRPRRRAESFPVASELEGQPLLFHYTRSCPGPWPGQVLKDYYRSLVEAEADAAHTAFDALSRILMERRLRASNFLTRGDLKAVSFTAYSPARIKELIRWRPGLVRWTFEPYGLAVPLSHMTGLGAEPVIYGNEEVWQTLPREQRFRFQFNRPGAFDWSKEKEWRVGRDLDLTKIPKSEIKIIVTVAAEALEIAEAHGLQVFLAPGFDRLNPQRGPQKNAGLF